MAVNNVTSSSTPPLTGKTVEGAKTEKAATVAKAGLNAYAAAAANKPSVKDAANVQISAKAKEMSAARKVIDETPDVREDKVAKFKELIAKGEYKPDASKIADGILKEAMKDELSKNPDVAIAD